MNYIKIESKQFHSFYPEMLANFPASELKSLEDFEELLAKGKYCAFGFLAEDEVVGMALGCLEEKVSIFWLDYLLVFDKYKGLGYGKRILNTILNANEFKEANSLKGILLEVEEPDNDDPLDQKNLRMKFYKRHNIQKIDCGYLFPCVDGTYIPLTLSFLPTSDIKKVSKDDIKAAVKYSVETIHYKLPHAQKVMMKYFNKINDLIIF